MSKYTIDQASHVIGSTDWKEVANITDQQVRKAALCDRDAQPLNPTQLQQFKNIKRLKDKLGL